jgi:protein-S-isoprenylcysteine O-methyltransferase Ste14
VQDDRAVLTAQALATAALAWPGRARWRLPRPVLAGAVAATLAGGALFVTSLVSQGRQLTAHVDPPAGARLLTEGPYRLSRHPVYAGLLLGAAGVAVLRRRPGPLVGWAALAAVLHLKTGMEEEQLRARFGPDYEMYATTTPRLIGVPGR